MKFGVNYTPSHGWFHAWLDPDWDGIDNDLKQIRAGDGIHLSDSPIVENKKVVFAQFPEFPHIILLELSSGVEFLEE